MMIITETERLYFRHLEPGDLMDLFRLYRDPEVRRFFPEGTLTLAETREELEWFQSGHPEHPELGLWATILKETGQFIGRCGHLPWTIDERPEVEVAYLIDKAFWGQGLGTEAARGIRDYALGELGLARLVCVIDKDHRASIRVAEKIGMVLEKEGCDELGPYHLYALEREKTHDKR